MARQRITATAEEMLTLRAQGKSNKEIALELGIGIASVYKYIGKQPQELHKPRGWKVHEAKMAEEVEEKVEEVAQPVAETPPEPQKGPSEPLETSEVQEVKEAPATPQKRKIIPTDRLFDFACIPNWLSKLEGLAKLAQSESWKFRNLQKASTNPDTYILEQYILHMFKFRVEEYNSTADNPDKIIHMRGKFCCFHTGLYSPRMLGIYAYFVPARPGTRQSWFFVGFFESDSPYLERIHPLPEHRTLDYEMSSSYDPNKPLRTNFTHITMRQDRVERFPEALRGYWNLPLLIETSLEYTRRRARIEPGTAVTASRLNDCAHLLPLFITNPNTPDVVALTEDVGDCYIVRTCITPEMAYLYARVNGRPTAQWLTALLDTDGGG